jgi:hypothetical protein
VGTLCVGEPREAYATSTLTPVAFVLEAQDDAHAEEHLGKIPLVTAGHLKLELLELHPFVSWSILFAP